MAERPMRVVVRRQWDDWRKATTDLSKISGLDWDNCSGGVMAPAPRFFLHGYVFCTDLEGDIAHSCRHGPPPHKIKVCLVKKDNEPEVWKTLIEMAPARPVTNR